jgi:predicted ATPase
MKGAQEAYSSKVGELEAVVSRGEELSKKLSRGRLATALPGLVLLIVGFSEPQLPSLIWQFGALLMVAFLGLATWQENLRSRIDWSVQQLGFYRRMLARCTRSWDGLKALPTEGVAAGYASDLSKDIDLFGDRSLFRWFSLAVSESGARTIAEWMTRWVAFGEIERRQQAVRELVGKRSWREGFWDAALGFRGCDTSPEKLAQWGASPSFFQNRKWLQIATWIGPALAIGAIALVALGVILKQAMVFNVGFVVFLVGVALNLLITLGIIGRIHDMFVQIGSANRELSSLVELFRLAEELEPQSAMLRELHSCFIGSGTQERSTVAIRKLQWRMGFAGIQRNPLFFIPYWILQLIMLWDFRVLEQLESWKARYGSRVGGWIDSLGKLEALASGAAVGDENGAWGYPVWSDQPDRSLEVQGLGHPLLADSKRVINDLRIAESHPLLLVTGSNMAGKSTLLRSLGINIVLGRLGSPVAAQQWRGPNCELASSIRVQDSLQDGVSFFMAELKRLRAIVDATRGNQVGSGRTTMVLLDEILQGTNSRERQIAVEQVLEQLVELGALVVTSTHDLELAGCPGIERISQVVHFREFFEKTSEGEQMRFDYKMRPGVTPTTNALKLLEMVGLAKRSV